jgi:hypothetical protein
VTPQAADHTLGHIFVDTTTIDPDGAGMPAAFDESVLQLITRALPERCIRLYKFQSRR